MDKIFNKSFKASNAILGTFILAIGFLNLSLGWIPILAPYSLVITGLIAFIITFGTESIKMLFNRPKKLIKTFFIFLPLAVMASFFSAIVLQVVLKLDLAANPAANNVPWLELPFMLLGEELISFFVFAIVASLLKNHNKKLLIATISSAMVFALLHVPTYWNGSILLSVLHVLCLQGVARLIFNSAAVKSNSIIAPWVIHVLFDSITFGIVILLT